jgi:hypothetical protein
MKNIVRRPGTHFEINKFGCVSVYVLNAVSIEKSAQRFLKTVPYVRMCSIFGSHETNNDIGHTFGLKIEGKLSKFRLKAFAYRSTYLIIILFLRQTLTVNPSPLLTGIEINTLDRYSRFTFYIFLWSQTYRDSGRGSIPTYTNIKRTCLSGGQTP